MWFRLLGCPRVVLCCLPGCGHAVGCYNDPGGRTVGCYNDPGGRTVGCYNDPGGRTVGCYTEPGGCAVGCYNEPGGCAVGCYNDPRGRTVCYNDPGGCAMGCYNEPGGCVVGCYNDPRGRTLWGATMTLGVVLWDFTLFSVEKTQCVEFLIDQYLELVLSHMCVCCKRHLLYSSCSLTFPDPCVVWPYGVRGLAILDYRSPISCSTGDTTSNSDFLPVYFFKNILFVPAINCRFM